MAYLLVNLKFCQRVDFITRVTLFGAHLFQKFRLQWRWLGKIYDTVPIFMCKSESGIDMLWNGARA